MYANNGVGLTLYSPNINLVRDPRWGRAQEVYGECPLQSSALVKSFVTGLQGSDAVTAKQEQKRMLTIASCKHLAAYDLEVVRMHGPQCPTGCVIPRTMFNANVSSRNFFETYAPIFESCLREAKAHSVMCSFNLLNGVPTCADGQLINGLLRERWDFDGFVVSDFDAWSNMVQPQSYVDNLEEAANAGLQTGLDQEGGGTAVVATIVNASKHIKGFNTSQVTQAFRRLMTARLRLGMFDAPTAVSYNAVPYDVCASKDHIALALTAAQKGLVLLQNKAQALPLKASGHQATGSLAVIGGLANCSNCVLGNYASAAVSGAGLAVSVLAGLRKVAPAATYSVGLRDVFVHSKLRFPAAVKAATAATTTVVVLGTRVSGTTMEPNDKDPLHKCEDLVACEGEGRDRNSTRFGGAQLALASALAKTGTKLVCVLIHGASMAMGSLLEDCDAIVDAGYGGAQGGNAIADAVFGKVSPAGRLAVTYYKDDSQLANFADMNLHEAGMTYRFLKQQPAFALGFGLSYSKFTYSKLVLPKTAKGCETITLQVTVANTGEFDCDEVVQVYGRQTNATAPQLHPLVRLLNFTRVHLPKGAKLTVQLELLPRNRAVVIEGRYQSGLEDFWHPSYRVEAGTLAISVGGDSSKGVLSGAVQITSEATATDAAALACGAQPLRVKADDVAPPPPGQRA